MPDSGADLPLALLHLSQPLAALLDHSRPGLMGVAKIRSRRAQNDLQHHARLLQRRLEVMTRTSPILRARSVDRRAIVTLLAARTQASKKTAIPSIF